MTKAFVLMTALPPTVGHGELIRYARELADDVTVLLYMDAEEPMQWERYRSLTAFSKGIAKVIQRVGNFPQNPEEHPRFWDFWAKKLTLVEGLAPGDYLVASEPYAEKLAQLTGAQFIPFDLNRTIRYSKATLVREDTESHFDMVLPEFKKYLRRTVTLFGAESVGKTTMAQDLADVFGATWYPEWARPYLEAVGPQVTVGKMRAIQEGQGALQRYAREHSTTLYNFLDTDLFSTLGYWRMYDPASVPAQLELQTIRERADLYVVLSSDIPFAPDALRYGGHVRESSDQYWLDICTEFDLPHVYIQGTEARKTRTVQAVDSYFKDISPLAYTRKGAEYAH